MFHKLQRTCFIQMIAAKAIFLGQLVWCVEQNMLEGECTPTPAQLCSQVKEAGRPNYQHRQQRTEKLTDPHFLQTGTIDLFLVRLSTCFCCKFLLLGRFTDRDITIAIEPLDVWSSLSRRRVHRDIHLEQSPCFACSSFTTFSLTRIVAIYRC